MITIFFYLRSFTSDLDYISEIKSYRLCKERFVGKSQDSNVDFAV